MSSDELTAKTQYVIEGLKKLYKDKLMPLESLYMYDKFYSPLMNDSEFDCPPQVLMIGQYSTGKTSFIEYLLGRSFPGQRVGPEPTTDRFVAVMYGPDERVIPGNAIAVQSDKPYRGLTRFGTAFLNKFEAAQLPCAVLQNMSIVDTPGILAGEKQRLQRGYNFVQVAAWFAERSDLILLLFDAHKLDISDEFKRTIEMLKGQDDKIRCILNKADQIDRQKLMRVYGALMWSMGKVLKTPEVLRVYIGSFWDQPLTFEENASLFEAEENDLMADLRSLPRNSAVRKINELVKRTRLAKVHTYIIGHLKAQMPTMMGKEKKQADLIKGMGNEFRKIQKQYNLAPGDFPNMEEFVGKLTDHNFSKFPKLKPKMVTDLEEVLANDIPRLMSNLPQTSYDPVPAAVAAAENRGSVANPFAAAPAANPFAAGGGDGADDWSLADTKPKLSTLFNDLGPSNGLLSGGEVMGTMQGTGCGMDDLRQIWELSDIDKDGSLDVDEFCVAMHLCTATAGGAPVPSSLPADIIPPSKR